MAPVSKLVDQQYEEEDVASIRRIIRGLNEFASCTPVIPEVITFLKKIESSKASEYRDINNKLSDYAQNAIQQSKGPLKPDKLLQFLLNDVFNKKEKNVLSIIRKYSSDADGVQKQLTNIHQIVNMNMEYRIKQNKLDLQFLKNIKNFNEAVEEEKDKETQSNKKQSNMKQFYETVQRTNSSQQTSEIRKKNRENSSKLEGVKGKQKSQTVSKNTTNYTTVKISRGTNTRNSQTKEVAEGVKSQKPVGKTVNSRKRKLETNAESSNSQNNEMTQITSRLSKRLKFNSSNESSQEPMSISEGCSSQNGEAMSISEGSNSQNSEAMSISEESNSDKEEPMSISSTSSSQDTDSLSSEGDSEENAYRLRSKTSPESSESLLAELDENEETVHERQFYLRGEPFRNISK